MIYITLLRSNLYLKFIDFIDFHLPACLCRQADYFKIFINLCKSV